NGLVIGFNRRPTELRGVGMLGFHLNYTHGRSIDTESGFRSNSSRVPYYNHKLFRAVSDFDLAHYLNISANWELPFHKAWPRGPSRLTQGWNLYPIASYRTGLPINIRSGISRTAARPGPSGAGDPNIVQANYVGTLTTYDPKIVQKAGNGRTGNFYFDPTAFPPPVYSGNAIPTQSTYGTLGRNAFRGPERTNVDLSISKLTSITERVKM